VEFAAISDHIGDGSRQRGDGGFLAAADVDVLVA
jgi:hypothetical protein